MKLNLGKQYPRLYIFQIPLLTLFRITISCFVQSRPLLNIKRAAIKITLRQQVQTWIILGKKGYTYPWLLINTRIPGYSLLWLLCASSTLAFVWFFRHIFIPILGTCSNGSIHFEHSSSRLYTERSFLTFMPQFKVTFKEGPCFSFCACLLSPFSHLTLCDPMNCSPPGSFFHGILQTRILRWVAMTSSRRYFWPRDWICISCNSCIAVDPLPLSQWRSSHFIPD